MIEYKKPQIITCRDCKHCYKCIERSRNYPCKDFKQTVKENEHDKQNNKRLLEK